MADHNKGLYKIPSHCRNGMRLYIEQGIPPGRFMRHVLENNLMESVGQADGININCLFDYCDFLYNYAPIDCHGSPKKVAAWIKKGGLA